jgi:spermidine/putrescine transport system substrate-binding protein
MSEEANCRPHMDPALVRGLTQRRFTRRDFLRGAGAGAGALGLSSLLAACGVSGSAKKPGATSSPVDFSKIYGNGEPAGILNFANWELYIDVDADGKSPTLEKFTEATGIKVNYKEDVTDVDPFLAKILPVLQAGQDTGYDMIVITDGGGIEPLIQLDYLVPLDHSFLPNFAKYASPAVKNPAYDPGNKYSVAWQSGYTIIGYNEDVVDPPPTSFGDLLDPKWKGKVGMFHNDTDLPCPALLYLGYDVQTSTPDQWREAAELLMRQRDAGIVRHYYFQEYIDALENHETVISQAWSGDLFIAAAPTDLGGDGHPEIKAAIPAEGGILWTDNQCIPVHAQHPVDAIMMMDFVYQPEIAAPLADYIWYVSPVPAAKDIVLNELDDPLVANSPLVFPTAAQLAQAQRYKVFKDQAEKEEWDSIFQPVFSS